MQSSSNLFPVALISAERRGDLSEDAYRLKPGNSPDSTVELAVTRLGLADVAQSRGVPVVLVTGDRTVTEEARALLGDIETVAVKEGIAGTAAQCG